ncbi:hypothetical protein LEN26_009963 [Aphanomyces euteiches]|nr:hypothetical protein LEN26_009963 [Aphanomyces euteiches]
MKKAKPSPPSCSFLPADILVNVAIFIADADDMFSFLEALHPLNILGPLEQIYKLGAKQKHANLWPSLRIETRSRNSRSRRLYEAIARYYPKVVVTDVEDIEWLKKLHIDYIEWILTDKWPLVRDWTSLPIRTLIQSHKADIHKGWTTILPQLQHLMSLQVATKDTGAISDVCAFAAQSRTLVELAIICDHGSMTILAVDHLVEWFNRQPVRLFDYRGYGYLSSGYNTQNRKLFRAIFDCPTLEILSLSGFILRDMDFDHITLFMKSLTLHICSHGSNDYVRRLAECLVGSKVTHLSLKKSSKYNHDATAIYDLFRMLPRTSVKNFEMHDYSVRSSHICKLTRLIALCKLESLALYVYPFSKTLATKLAHAIQLNQTICELDLKRSNIDLDDIQLMIQSITHASRKVKTKRIKFNIYRRAVNTERVTELEQLARELGGELMVLQENDRIE